MDTSHPRKVTTRDTAGTDPQSGLLLNVFYVGTPLQLLNALEAKAAMSLDHTVLVVLAYASRRAQIEALVNDDDWNEVYVITVPADVRGDSPRLRLLSALYAARRQIDRIIRTVGDADTLFLGNFGSGFGQHLASSLRHRRLVLLDDGMATIGHAERRAGAEAKASRSRRLRRQIRDIALGLRRHEPDAVTFFTALDIVVTPPDDLVPNDYSRLRSLMVSAELLPETLFLGQPLVEDNQVDEALYERYVYAAKLECGGARFVYAPHPRESRERIQQLQRRLGCDVRINVLPIEVELAISGCLPTTLASFCSSAIDNCRILFGGMGMTIMAYVVADEDLLEGGDGALGSMYAYLRRNEGPGFILRRPDMVDMPSEEMHELQT